ncbi:MAG: RNA polymerase sigma factor RpoD/SigA [Gemmatimonadetes bacterium]|nr:RNA polymerase sigma factor RpoD/SigA [Gemmatimonadota bacterium]
MASALTRTESDDLSLEIYLKEIRRTDLLTPEQEVELAKRIKSGDRSALDELVQANLRFVVSVARSYAGRGLPLADLINEGNVGLIKAAERFDHERGFRFISYAIWWIRQAILQALSEQTRVVRVPVNRVGKASKIERTASGLIQALGREPTIEEIAREMELTEDDVAKHRQYTTRPVSLDAPASDEGESSLGSLLEDDEAAPPDQKVVELDLHRDLRRAIGTLDRREQKILRDYFGMETGEGTTLEAIGKDLGLTRERVRQLKERAMRKLQQADRSERLRSYLN